MGYPSSRHKPSAGATGPRRSPRTPRHSLPGPLWWWVVSCFAGLSNAAGRAGMARRRLMYFPHLPFLREDYPGKFLCCFFTQDASRHIHVVTSPATSLGAGGSPSNHAPNSAPALLVLSSSSRALRHWTPRTAARAGAGRRSLIRRGLGRAVCRLGRAGGALDSAAMNCAGRVRPPPPHFAFTTLTRFPRLAKVATGKKRVINHGFTLIYATQNH